MPSATISGGHFNPAVTLGLAIGGRFAWSDSSPTGSPRCVGGIVAAVVLYLIASGKAGLRRRRLRLERLRRQFAGRLRPLRRPADRAGADRRLPDRDPRRDPPQARRPGFAPLAIGLALTLIHLVSIPVTNTSVNPARSTAVAFFAETGAVGQLWLFWVAPLVGARARRADLDRPAVAGRMNASGGADARDHPSLRPAVALDPRALAARGDRRPLRHRAAEPPARRPQAARLPEAQPDGQGAGGRRRRPAGLGKPGDRRPPHRPLPRGGARPGARHARPGRLLPLALVCDGGDGAGLRRAHGQGARATRAPTAGATSPR